MAADLDTFLVIGEVRFAHPHFFEPRPVVIDGKASGDPNYEVQAMFAKDNPEAMASLDGCKKTAIAVAAARWPGRNVIEEAKGGEFMFPFKDGDREADRFDRRNPQKAGQRDYMRGNIILACRSKFAPEVVGPDKKPIMNERDIYGGCYGYIQVNVKAYNGVGQNPDGVKCYLQMVLKSRNGDKLGNARSAADVFGGIKDADLGEDATAGMDMSTDIPF
ncbi:ssDNA-binding protein [uncultured Rhodospira sp.]|uniref:ssDNA-binding protein n=1 Tax=uncultured Rhodospira sp. TaxID=1936189 RepID=UPI002634308E|nr:ssDNA-binding protein [uncultured Rhodospira sp.]